MRKKCLCLALAVILLAGLLAGCAREKKAEAPSAQEKVTLLIAGGWEDCKEIEAVGHAFTAKYPACEVEYEYLQDYYVSLEKRMAGENAVDIFFTTNLQADSAMTPYALEVNGAGGIDLANTFAGLIENFALLENGVRTDKLYAIPLGAEMRGLYVNTTLLKSLGIAVPTNQAEFLSACETLKQNGYIPCHGNPADFGHKLLYPWVCNLIANASDPAAAYAAVNARGEGVSAMFAEPMTLLYTLIENGYYDYKRAQSELNLFTDTREIAYARDFLDIVQQGDTWAKASDIGRVAFLPSAMSMRRVMETVKADYHSQIEFVFIPAPVGKEGGFVYLSPAHGIAANKNSAKLEWSKRFLDFLFQPENNKLYAQESNIIPNTKEAFAYIRTLYDVPDSRISHLGQVTFGFDFYGAITDGLLTVSKGNNPKYMQQNADGTTSLYPLEYYMRHLEAGLRGNEQ